MGEDVKIRAGEKRIYYGGGTSPICGYPRRVIREYGMSRVHIGTCALITIVDALHVSVFP